MASIVALNGDLSAQPPTHAFLGSEQEVVPVHHFVEGRLHAPRVCPHDDRIFSVEAAHDGINRLWLSREPEAGLYAVSPMIEVTPASTPDEMIGLAERSPASYAGELEWCPVDHTPGRYWYVYVSTDADGSTDLYLGNTEQPGSIRLTRLPGREVHPVWRSDGDTVVFVAAGVGNGDLYAIGNLAAVMRNLSDAPLGPVPLTSGPAVDTHPDISPDGGYLVFSRRDEGGDYHLRAIDLDRVTPVGSVPAETIRPRSILRLDGQVTRGSFAPDASAVAFYHSEGAFDTTVDLMYAALSSSVPWRLERPTTVARDVQPDDDGPTWGPSRGAQPGPRALVFLQRQFDGDTALVCVDMSAADGPAAPRMLHSDARVITGFDFATECRGAITGQRGENYVAYRAPLLGAAFRSGWSVEGSTQ